ncbi:EamA family transporter, partial [Salmonella enterica subsp. enterica serovar Kottbus]|nr:EamA family transporter [Salmonella enterica subsp. enterica serovar Kottbus]
MVRCGSKHRPSRIESIRRRPTVNANMTDSAFRTNLLLLLVLSTLWGASYTLIKVGVETIPPITFIAGRTVIAGAVLLLVLRWRGLKLPRDRRLWAMFMVQACLNSVIPFTLIAWAETRIDAGLAIILNSLSPVMTFLLTALITRHEAVSTRKLFGIVAGFAGALLI